MDDFWIDLSVEKDSSDNAFIEQGSAEKMEKSDLSEKVKSILRDHKEFPVNNPIEQRVRQSFDDLLDFFNKLDYYFRLKLIKKEELEYFRYLLEKCSRTAEGGVLLYGDAYGYHSLFRILRIMEIPHP